MNSLQVEYFSEIQGKQVAILTGDETCIRAGVELTYDNGHTVKVVSTDSKHTRGSVGVLLIGDIDRSKTELFY